MAKGEWRNMKHILVTGGAGMIGSNLVKRLVQEGQGEVRVADNLWRGKREYLGDETGKPVIDMETNFFKVDLRNPEACRQAVEGVVEVYHLADVVAGIGYVFKHQTEVFHDNLVIDSNMLKAAAEAGVARFVYVGTACSYPKDKQYGAEAPPLTEDDVLPAYPESGYGWSKLMGELQTELYGRETNMQTGVLRFHNVYGHPTDFSPERSQVIPSLIAKAIMYPEYKFDVWGSGSQGRSFVYVDDIVDSLLLMMEKGLGKGTIQIGTDYCTTVREIAEAIIKISGKKIEISYDLSKPEGDKGRCGDSSKAENILGWKKKIDLEEGIRRTYAWISEKIRYTS
jgi:nucleoside-diphosphate-sugar epimerase